MSDVAASYARVATQGPGDTSLLTQQAVNRALAQNLGYKIPLAFDWLEQGSGLDPTRSKFLALQDAVARRLISAVFVRSPDRLARNRLVVMQFVRLCEESAVELHFADRTTARIAADEALAFLLGPDS